MKYTRFSEVLVFSVYTDAFNDNSDGQAIVYSSSETSIL